MQQQAANALVNLAVGLQHNKDAIIAARASLALVAVLRSDQCAVQKAAVGALKVLAYSSQPKDAIIATGAVPSLVVLLGSTNHEVQQQAAGALWNLAVGNRTRMPSLQPKPRRHVLGSTHRGVTQQAAGAWWNLAIGSQRNRDAIIAAQALPALAAFVEVRSGQRARGCSWSIEGSCV